MKQINIFLISIVMLFSSQSSFGQWTEISLASPNSIEQLNFLTDDLGYILELESSDGTRVIKKTSNGGDSWTEIDLPALDGQILDVHFHADNEGVVVMRDNNSSILPVVIFQTLDDGVSWQNISPDSTDAGLGLAQGQFLDQNTGFLAAGNQFYATTDQGVTWSQSTLPGYAESMDFIDANHGTVGLFDGTFFYAGGMASTSDGGSTWNNSWLNETQTVIEKVIQFNSTVAYASPATAGGYGHHKFFKTTDNGLSWDTIFVPDALSESSLNGMDFKDELNGTAVVSSFNISYIYQTDDGGMNWILQDSIADFDILDLAITPNSGYISGYFGAYYKLINETNAVLNIVDADFELFPNPAQSGQAISITTEEDFSNWAIVNAVGQRVYQQIWQQNELRLPSLRPGIYLLQFQNGQSLKTAKLVVK